MTDQQIKVMFSKEILRPLRLGDASADMCEKDLVY